MKDDSGCTWGCPGHAGQLESHNMRSSEVSTFPRVLDGGAHADLAMPQLESHSMHSSEVNTFPRVLDGGTCTGPAGLLYLTLIPRHDAFNTFPRVLDERVYIGLAVPQVNSHIKYS